MLKDQSPGLLIRLKQLLNNRRRYSYSAADYVVSLFSCIVWCLRCKNKKCFYHRNKLFSKGNLHHLHLGVQQFSNELDCISIVRSIKQMRSMMQVLLTENQLVLLKHDRSNMIDFDKELEPVNKSFHKLNTTGKPLKVFQCNLKREKSKSPDLLLIQSILIFNFDKMNFAYPFVA